MLSYLTLCVLAFAGMAVFSAYAFAMIGPGLYNVEHVSKCGGSEADHLFICDVIQRKYNRTHSAFNATILLKKIFDHSYSVKVRICKYVDGGCKLYQVFHDDDLIHFMNEYTEGNVKRFLQLAGVDPPVFPISEGTLSANNFIYDYEELPDFGVYGKYEAQTTAMDRNGTVVGCIEMKLEFKEYYKML